MDGDASVLPLINVVFLLLVFFMVAGRLSGGDPFEVTPPESGTEGPAATAPMRVLLAADGRLALDGEAMGREALLTAVAARLEAEPEAELRVKADGAAEGVALAALVADLAAAGVREARLVTTAPRR
ncbi:MAG TPA: biopolymer transporter ExbD [Paracoccaceae bacterium]|nr:biopolymer transporter ExbD [Paracoccaceae bacterium]